MSVRKSLVVAGAGLGLLAALVFSLLFLRPRAAAFRGHTDLVTGVIASPDGKALASVSQDRTVKIWDVATGRERATLQERAADIAFSPDSRLLASAGDMDRTVKLWDVHTGRKRAVFRGHQDEVLAVAFSPDGKTLVSGSGDKTVKLWDLTAGQERATLRGHTSWVTAIAFSPDGKTLASGSLDETVRLWDVSTGEGRVLLREHGWTDCLAFSPDGKTLAAGHHLRAGQLWDVAARKCLATLDGHDENIDCLAFSPDGKTLASLGNDERILLWDVPSGRIRTRFEKDYHRPRPRLFRMIRSFLDSLPGPADEHANVPLTVRFTPDGKIVAMGYDARADSTVKMWPVGNVPTVRE